MVPESRASTSATSARGRPATPSTVIRPEDQSAAIVAPRARRPSTMASVSSACRALVSTEVPSASAAHTRARLVMLLEPGSVTATSRGPLSGATG